MGSTDQQVQTSPSMVLDTIVMTGDGPLAVRVHRPADAALSRQPAVVVLGSWLTVKEQMADTYAARLAAAGLTAVTFDFAGFGASGGEPRQTEMPVRKAENLRAVVDHLRSLALVDPGRIGVLAVCASAQYTLAALTRGLPVASFVSVAGWFHDTDSVAGFYGGSDGVAQRLERSSRAARAWANDDDPVMAPAYAAGDDSAGMSMEMDYYANRDRGNKPEWRNEMNELSWSHWLLFDAFVDLDAVTVPTLFVHSENAVLPENVKRLVEALGERASVTWTEGEQTDFYDQPTQVSYAVAAAVGHFESTWGGGA